MSDTGRPLLRVREVRKYFQAGGLRAKTSPAIKAVDGVSLSVYPEQSVGIIGESGCGKSTLARLILRLEEPTAGSIEFRGRDVGDLNRQERRSFRTEVQAVLQDPTTSLNPKLRIRELVAEPLVVNRKPTKAATAAKVSAVLSEVGLDAGAGDKFPHQFSGGQRQRVAIARALSVDPSLLVLDEPVSSLDVSVRATVLNLLQRLKDDHRMSYVFIAHDLPAVLYLCDVVAVMYLGEVVEFGSVDDVLTTPQHPYTRALVAASSIEEGDADVAVVGDPPSPANPPSGCRFRTRCPLVFDRCSKEHPRLLDVGGSRRVACHLLDPEEQR